MIESKIVHNAHLFKCKSCKYPKKEKITLIIGFTDVKIYKEIKNCSSCSILELFPVGLQFH